LRLPLLRLKLGNISHIKSGWSRSHAPLAPCFVQRRYFSAVFRAGKTNIRAAEIADSGSALRDCVAPLSRRERGRGEGKGSVLGAAAGALFALAAAVLIASPARATTLAAGYGHSCAIAQGGTVYCWGDNSDYQLGDDGNTASLTPVQVKGVGGVGTLSGMTLLAAGWSNGYFSCAVGGANNALYCWGNGEAAPVAVSLDDGVTPLTGVTALAAGGDGKYCAVTGGAVYCGPDSNNGDLWAVDPAIISGATAVAVGSSHACALVQGGEVRCWGNNGDGQLGDGSTTDSASPVAVRAADGGAGNLTGVTALAAGEGHTCALRQGGAVVCWGDSDYGQIGNGNNGGHEPAPVTPSGNLMATALAASEYHTCAARQGGGVSCWGWNRYGELGNGNFLNQDEPVDVVGLPAGFVATEVAAGSEHTCARQGAMIYCWGQNDYGQLGNNAPNERQQPQPVRASDGSVRTDIAAISAGAYHTCARTTNGSALCWGNNSNGQLGTGDSQDRRYPAPVGPYTSVVNGEPVNNMGQVFLIEAGASHTCAALSRTGLLLGSPIHASELYCWGDGADGRLGTGDSTSRLTPRIVSNSAVLSAVGAPELHRSLSAGFAHGCAVWPDGVARCWGSNSSGELGVGDFNPRPPAPQEMSVATLWQAISAGHGHSCGLSASGGARCWGGNHSGQLGDGNSGSNANRSSPFGVTGLFNSNSASAISAGSSYSCAIDASPAGAALCWGWDVSGRLGNGVSGDTTTPGPVIGLDGSGPASRAIQLSTGAFHACVLTQDGQVHCWGENLFGQLGVATVGNGSSHVPLAVPLDAGSGAIAGVTAGGSHTCAWLDDGSAFCWGYNDDGQLGNGESSVYETAQAVVGFPADAAPVARISGGGGAFESAGPLTFTVSLNLPPAIGQTVSVSYVVEAYSLNGGDPADNGDLQAPFATLPYNGQLNFTAANPSQDIVVAFVNDSDQEANEGFRVRLTGANFDPAQNIATGEIQNDDLPNAAMALSISGVDEDEGNGSNRQFQFKVTRINGDGTSTDVTVSTGAPPAGSGYDPAEPGQDYAEAPSPATLTFNGVGTEEKTVMVTVTADSDYEPVEAFAVDINAANITLTSSQALGVIRNDDPQAPGLNDIFKDGFEGP